MRYVSGFSTTISKALGAFIAASTCIALSGCKLKIKGVELASITVPSISATMAVADGAASSTITIALDTDAGVTPTIWVTGSNNTVGACSATDASGVSTCALRSTTPEAKTITVTSPSDATHLSTQVHMIPSVTVASPAVYEGGTAVFTLTLAQAYASDITLSYSTQDGAAIAGTNYVASSGTITIPAGQTSITISVPTLDDGAANTLRTFSLNIGGVTASAPITGTGTIAGAAVNLNFASGSLPSEVTFTRASTATYHNSSGIIQTAAINAPRFDYDPSTLAARGLLMESSVSNGLTYSEDLTNAAWTLSGVSVVANATTAPDGAMTADKIVETVGGTEHGVFRGSYNYAVAGSRVTFSFYVKPAERGGLSVMIHRGGIGDGVGWNLTTGADNGYYFSIGGGGPYFEREIQALPNGWYRISSTHSWATTGAVNVVVDMLQTPSNGVAFNYAGDGSSGLYLWGFQFEVNGFASSYIPTTNSVVTRSADSAIVSTLNPWYDQTKGTVLFEGDVTYSSGSNVRLPYLFSLNATVGSYNLAMFLDPLSSGAISYGASDNGVVQALTSAGGSASSEASFKAAFAYATNDFIGAVNNTLGTADTSANVPVVDRLSVGAHTTGAITFMDGHVKSLKYFPVRISNTELRALTQ